jgi:hypothetical protein
VTGKMDAPDFVDEAGCVTEATRGESTLVDEGELGV